MGQLWRIIEFVRSIQRRMRFGEISRAPLKLLRLEVQGEAVRCDWAARLPDDWDQELPVTIQERNASFQALQDAMELSKLLFGMLPGVHTAALRAFRQSERQPDELIIAGTVTREVPAAQTVSSLAMRAKLAGLNFWLEDGVLKALEAKESIIRS